LLGYRCSQGRPADSQAEHIGGSGYPTVSATKKNSVVETNREGSLSLPFAPIREGLAGENDEPPWLVRGYVANSAITLWSGWPKVGKSTLLFALVSSLQEGTPFLDLPTTESGVLLLTEERKGTLISKVQRWNLNGSVHCLRRQQALEASWATVVHQATVHCHRHGLDVLVVDTFSEWARIVNENDAGEVLGAVDALQIAAGSGLAVIVASHQRKAPGRFGEAVRGSNALTGAVDIVIELERSRSSRESNVRVLRAISRFEDTPEDLVVALTDDGYEVRGDSETAKTEEESMLVLSVLDDLRSGTSEQLAEVTELHESKVRGVTNRLFEAERIGRTGTGRRNDPFVWHRDSVSTTLDSLVVETKSLFDEGEP
jgi:predicted ATP-dependent serine protease